MKYIEKFLKPLDKKLPAGQYLQYEPIYDQLGTFEQDANAFFTQVSAEGDIWEPAESNKIDWKVVIKTCEEALIKDTKDIQIIYWLIFAKSKYQGIKGVYEGLSLFYSILNKFWDHCHPQPDDKDYSLRLGVINRLRNQLALYFSIADLVQPTEGPVFNYLDYQMTNSQSPGCIDLEEIQRSINSTKLEFFNDFLLTANQIKAILDDIDNLLEEKLIGDDSSFLQSKDRLDEILNILPTEKTQDETTETSDATNDTIVDAPSSKNLIDTAINSRKDAFLTLQKISNVLKDIEPQSMVPSIIDQIVQWQLLTTHKISEQLQERGFSFLDLIKMFPDKKK